MADLSVNIKDLKEWALDIKNPTQEETVEIKSPNQILQLLNISFSKSSDLLIQIQKDING